jgi:hypothetical protein
MGVQRSRAACSLSSAAPFTTGLAPGDEARGRAGEEHGGGRVGSIAPGAAVRGNAPFRPCALHAKLVMTLRRTAESLRS